jgi:hypothetical protein
MRARAATHAALALVDLGPNLSKGQLQRVSRQHLLCDALARFEAPRKRCGVIPRRRSLFQDPPQRPLASHSGDAKVKHCVENPHVTTRDKEPETKDKATQKTKRLDPLETGSRLIKIRLQDRMLHWGSVVPLARRYRRA